MKVYIGPYIYRWTSQIHTRYMDWKYGYLNSRDSSTRFEKLLEKIEDLLQSLYNATINKYLDKKERKVKVRVDRYDAWNADHTLALVILPVLKKLKETKHGSPYVDPADVPEELRPTVEASDDNGHTDNTHHERWTWILDEMIWAFENIVDDKEDQFYTYREDTSYKNDQWMLDIDFDHDGIKAYHERIKRGTTLFGKYYRGLWD